MSSDLPAASGRAPLVSVGIPTYNQPGYLCQAIDSVLAQTFADFEIVVVNDGSTDDTLARLAAAYPHEGRLRVVTQANTGIGGARNRAIAEARGRYVALLDHDDWWLPEKLACQVEFLQAHPDFAAVSVPYAGSDAPDTPVVDPADLPMPGGRIDRPFARLAEGKTFVITSALMIDREKTADLRYGTVAGAVEDVQFQIQLLGRGPMGIAGDRVLAVWRSHAGNYSKRHSWYYHGQKLLRRMEAAGAFAEVTGGDARDLQAFLAHWGRNVSMSQALGRRRGRGLEIYLREWGFQARLGRWSFLLVYPLLLLSPGWLIDRLNQRMQSRTRAPAPPPAPAVSPSLP